MALLSRSKDGSWLIETRLDLFLERWKETQRHNRLVLPDHRPAVRTISEDGISYLTIHPEAWDRMKRAVKPLLKQGEIKHPHRTRLCEFCHTELKVKREFHDCWVFHCPSCETNEIHSKSLVGGTIGAGEKEKT